MTRSLKHLMVDRWVRHELVDEQVKLLFGKKDSNGTLYMLRKAYQPKMRVLAVVGGYEIWHKKGATEWVPGNNRRTYVPACYFLMRYVGLEGFTWKHYETVFMAAPERNGWRKTLDILLDAAEEFHIFDEYCARSDTAPLTSASDLLHALFPEVANDVTSR